MSTEEVQELDPQADLRELLGSAVDELDRCVQLLDRHFPRPQVVKTKQGPALRHVKGRSDLLASHLKCVRAVAALNSAIVLLDHGQVQDVYALCRIVDEQQEDVMFLSTPLGKDNQPSEEQVRFCREFYQEEFLDDVPLMQASQERDRVPRKKIRAALARIPLPNMNPSDAGTTSRMVYNTFSGFVHGAYVHIMEQFDGRRYRTRPSSHPRWDECADSLTSYIYRACAAAAVVAARCSDPALEQRLRKTMDKLSAGTECVPTDEELHEIRARVKRRPAD